MATALTGAGSAPLAVRLAALLARPLDGFAAASTALPPFTPTELAKASRLPAFSGPLSRAIARTLALPAQPIEAALIERLDHHPTSRLATLILIEPISQVNAAGARLAAAIVHSRVVRATLRSERERLRAVLGVDGFDLATREAPLMHAPLAALDIPQTTTMLLSGDVPTEAAAAQLRQFGVAALTRFAALVEPAYAGLLPLRWPAACATPASVPDEVQSAHIVKLLRRMPQWSALIG